MHERALTIDGSGCGRGFVGSVTKQLRFKLFGFSFDLQRGVVDFTVEAEAVQKRQELLPACAWTDNCLASHGFSNHIIMRTLRHRLYTTDLSKCRVCVISYTYKYNVTCHVTAQQSRTVMLVWCHEWWKCDSIKICTTVRSLTFDQIKYWFLHIRVQRHFQQNK